MGECQKGFIIKFLKTDLKNASSLKYKWKYDDFFWKILQYFSKIRGNI
jgi:hypothetical protein